MKPHQFILLHPCVGMLVIDGNPELEFDGNAYQLAIDIAWDIGADYDMNDIGTLKSRAHIIHPEIKLS